MPKTKRIYNDASKHYFVTSKTYRNAQVFTDERIVRILLNSIKYLQEQRLMKLFAWVALPDHIHLLLEITGKKNISEVMHDFKSYSANQVSRLFGCPGRDALLSQLNTSRGTEASATVNNKYKESVGEASLPCHVKVLKLWKTSFHDHIIRDQKDLYAHLDYIHYNPVKHSYANKPEDWQWSSYHEFLRKGYYEKGWGYNIPISIRKLRKGLEK